MKKSIFLAVLLTAAFSLGAQNTDTSKEKMEEIVKQINEVAKSDEPIEVRRAKVGRMIREFSEKNPGLALEQVDRASRGDLAKDKTKLVSDQMVAVVVDLYKEAYALEHPDGQTEHPKARGVTREQLCITEYCTQSNKPLSCYNPNNPIPGFCIVTGPVGVAAGTPNCLPIDVYTLATACNN